MVLVFSQILSNFVFGVEFRDTKSNNINENGINLEVDVSLSNENGNNNNLQLTTPFPSSIMHNHKIEASNMSSDNLNLVKQLGHEDIYNFTRVDSVVLFYVPWCMFCREMIPEFDKAAQILKYKQIKFGKIDANEHRQIVLMEQIIKFPTIKVYSEGIGHYYNGLSNAVSITNFINTEFDRDLSILDIESLKLFTSTDKSSIKMIAIVNETQTNSTNTVSVSYSKISRKYHNIFFAHTFLNNTDIVKYILYKSNNSKLRNDDSTMNKSNLLAIITPWNDNSELFDLNRIGMNENAEQGVLLLNDIDFNDYGLLESLVHKYQFPLIIDFNPFIAQKLFSGNKPIAFIFINKDTPNYNLFMERYRNLAIQFRGDIIFVRSGNSLPHEKRISQVLVNDENEFPVISIIRVPEDNNDNSHILLPPNMPPIKQSQAPLIYKSRIYGQKLLQDSNIEHFINEFISGRIEPYYKSEEPPSEEDNTGAVRIVVSKTFKKEVIDNNLDVFIVFFAPWCGHCRKLEPDFHSLAFRLQGLSDKLKIAKIDGSQNDVPNIQIFGFPTLLLFKSGEKDKPMFYGGDRTIIEMIQWLSENVSNKFDPQVYLNPENAFEDDDLDMALSHEL
ncbi:hypothetical protein FG386_000651 [Cryptosporidium ryanae]|uniref:uncharacterized protein n=1 Tax=Cryptosporidium ryanae TaxID=515981 RepID=UPI003519F145|nr:hypothetical protein FG386_000651 [Cryptosporidium ryanae]